MPRCDQMGFGLECGMGRYGARLAQVAIVGVGAG
jgi:hypothetical protein